MAKEEPQASPDGAKPDDKPKKGGKLIPLLLVVNMALVAGLAAFLFLGGHGSGGAHKEKDKEAKEGEAAKEEEGAKAKDTKAQMGPVVELDPFLVNLDESGQARYLKVTIQFEMSTPQASEELKARTVPTRDLIITYLSSLNFSQTQGQVNKEIIRTSLMKRINASLSAGEVKNIYFTDFVIQ